MSFMLHGEKKFIIDKTVIEVVTKNKNINKEELDKFCVLLHGIGADFIEIDRDAMKIMNSLNKDINYIYRISNLEDINICNSHEFKYALIDFHEDFDLNLRHIKKLHKVKLIFEVTFENLSDVFDNDKFSILKNKLQQIKEYCNVYSLRLKGINKCMLHKWEEAIKKFKEDLNVKIDICANNKFYMATAVAMESAVGGADYITTTFLGEGFNESFAALEELILSLKVIKGYILSGNTKLLPQVSEYYKKITNQDIYSAKAVIGEDIFKCESGIHVDGIQKKADTYEPYNPKEIGQKRKIVIGKHSGSKAVINKLKELNINLNFINITHILEEIKALSMQLRHEISDEELIKMINLK